MKLLSFKRLSVALGIAVFLIALVLSFTTLTVGAASSKITDGAVTLGRDFTELENLQVSKDFDKMPKTYEAVVYVKKNTASEHTIFGNYVNLSTPHVNFVINKAGYPMLYVHDQNGNQTKTTFTNKSIWTDGTSAAWMHVVITHEPKATGDVLKCYVNGSLVHTVTTDFNQELDMTVVQQVSSMYLGQDFRKDHCFKGRIKDVAIYSEALSSSEIKSSYNNGVNTSHSALMAYYDLENKDGATAIPDSSKNGNDIKPLYHEREEEFTDYDYSFAVVGDTQFLMDDYINNGTDYFSGIYDWIAANKESKKIVHYLGLGDIVENNTAAEWEYAASQFKKLEAVGLPYTPTWGYSHDGLKGEEFTTYFGTSSNFDDVVSFGTDATKRLANYYRTFTVGSTDYMILSLGWLPGADVLSWADEAVKSHPNHKVIVITHYYLLTDATVSEEAIAIWNDLVSLNSNVVLVMSGHIQYASNIVRTEHKGQAGHTVTEMLINPQYMDKYYGYGSTGSVAMLYFSENGSKVRAEYISTTKTRENNNKDVLFGAKNQFEFTFKASESTLETKYGTISSEYMDPNLYPFVIFSEEYNKETGKWEKKLIGASNSFIGTSSNKTAHAMYIAKDYLKSNVYKNGSYGDTPIKINILLRKNYTMNAKAMYNDFSQIQGEVNIDLDGHILTAPAEAAMFSVELKDWSGSGDSAIFPSTITMRNGDIILTAKDLIYFKNGGSTGGNGKSFTFNFNSVDFLIQGAASKLTSNNTIAVDEVYLGIHFTDCNFDLTQATYSTFTLFRDSDTNGRAKNSLSMNGGSITLGQNALKFFHNSTVAPAFSFGDGSAYNYTTVIAPKNVTTKAPTDKFNGGTLFFDGGTTDDLKGVTTYTLLVNDIEGFGSYPAEYASRERYPFVIFKSDKTFYKAARYFYGDKELDSAINLAKDYLKANVWDGASYGDGELTAYIFMRRDVAMYSYESYNNLAQIQGTLNIDLGGFEITAPEAKPLFPAHLKEWSSSGDAKIYPTAISISNGAVKTSGAEVIYFADNSTATGKTFDFSFKGVDFTLNGSSVNFAFKYNTTTSLSLATSVSFTDCEVDVSGATEPVTLFDLGNKVIGTALTVKGGSVTAGAAEYTFYTNANNTGNLTLKKGDDGKYVTLTQNKNSSIPALKFTGENGAELAFVINSEKENDVTCILLPALLSTFAPKTSVTLYTDFKYNVYLPKTASLTEVKLGENTINIGDLEIVNLDGEDYYKLPQVSLNADESLCDIKLTVTLKAASDSYSGSFLLGLYEYASTVISGSTSADEKNLAKDMLSYAKAAYIYWNNTSDKLDGVDALLGSDYSSAADMSAANTATAPSGTGFTGVTFHLGDAPAYRFYYEGAAPSYTFTVGERTVGATFGTDENGKTYLEVKVYAYEILLGVTFGDHSYSVYTYYAWAKANGMNAEMTLVERLVNYCESAEAYRASVVKAN